MDWIRVWGGRPLEGTILIQGSKNAALPILAATILTDDANYLIGCPRISDVYSMIEIMECIGCKVKWDSEGLSIEGRIECMKELPADATKAMRSSIFLLGALLSRCHMVEMEYPGGCVIGQRPIDLHVLALSQMGVCFWEENNRLFAKTRGLVGTDVFLPFPSVGATENIILAATLAKGKTRIYQAAKEPEVVALCCFLNSCGAKIRGYGTSYIEIDGVKKLHGTCFKIPKDRIVAGTYLLATTATGGNVFLENAPVEQLQMPIAVAKRMGTKCIEVKDGLYIKKQGKPGVLPYLYTAPYPGFPTDLQSPFLVCRCVGKEKTLIEERIFENRFRVVDELKKMGATIKSKNVREVEIWGNKTLHGASIVASELRGAAALIVAGLVAEGETFIQNASYIERGYENICKDLRELGARIIGG